MNTEYQELVFKYNNNQFKAPFERRKTLYRLSTLHSKMFPDQSNPWREFILTEAHLRSSCTSFHGCPLLNLVPLKQT